MREGGGMSDHSCAAAATKKGSALAAFF